MKRIKVAISGFARDERGATAIEYGLIAGFISLAIVAGATQIGTAVNGFFQSAAAGFN